MKLDDYDEFNDEKPDEDDYEAGTDAGRGGKTSTGAKAVFGGVLAVILALIVIAVLFSFRKDEDGYVIANPAKESTTDTAGRSTEQKASVQDEKESTSVQFDAADQSGSAINSSKADEVTTEFLSKKDKVTAKDVVNLRSMPSITNENVEVVGILSKGEVLERTGINYEMGWSRLDYNGQTVYAITSYLEEVQE